MADPDYIDPLTGLPYGVVPDSQQAAADNSDQQRDDLDDPSSRDAGHTDPAQITDVPPPGTQTEERLDATVPLRDSDGRPIHRSDKKDLGGQFTLQPSERGTHNYTLLKVLGNAPTDGAAFNAKDTAAYLINRHAASGGDHFGYCQAAVREALVNGGHLDVPMFGAAKEMISYLSNLKTKEGVNCFDTVASGHGNYFNNSTSHDYVPQIGDTMVYRGGPGGEGVKAGIYGHIQMCVGFRPDGSAVWMSDFEGREGNLSGMAGGDRGADLHGGDFYVFRQKTKAQVLELASKPAETDPARSKIDPTQQKAEGEKLKPVLPKPAPTPT